MSRWFSFFGLWCLTPEQWWDAHVQAILYQDVGDRVALATQLRDDLLEIKQDGDLAPDTRNYFHELWSQMPEIIVQLREEAEQQQRRPTGWEAIQQFIDAAGTSGLDDRVSSRNRIRATTRAALDPTNVSLSQESLCTVVVVQFVRSFMVPYPYTNAN